MPADHLTEEPAFLPEDSEERRWVHASVTFPDWETAEQPMASAVAPLLDAVTPSWSYLRKHPCWRVRARDTPPGAVEDVLRGLQDEGIITGWQPGTYEPETFAFGGPTGMDITHDLFCADSHAILAYIRVPRGTGRREASLLAISAMLTAAGLDTFERGDVMGKVGSLRPPAPASGDPNMTALTAQLRTLLATPPVPALAQLSAEPWGLAFYTAGHRLAQAAGTGTLTRGLRAVLAHNVIFHWNRLGLSAKTQGILASAARDAWIPAD